MDAALGSEVQHVRIDIDITRYHTVSGVVVDGGFHGLEPRPAERQHPRRPETDAWCSRGVTPSPRNEVLGRRRRRSGSWPRCFSLGGGPSAVAVAAPSASAVSPESRHLPSRPSLLPIEWLSEPFGLASSCGGPALPDREKKHHLGNGLLYGSSASRMAHPGRGPWMRIMII
jgi:hypothetical protein